jgi:hypothetical protein
MFQKKYRSIVEVARENLGLHKSRAEVFAALILTVIQTKSVLVSSIVAKLPGKARRNSKYRRVQNFYREVKIDYNAVAVFIVKLLSPVLADKWTLSVDRTNWTSRGNEVNLLTLGVCLGDVAVPLFWIDLRRPGNSTTSQRTALMEGFMEVFGKDRIGLLLGDREFVGEDWFGWLQGKNIPYVMRLRKDFTVLVGSGRRTQVKNCFRNLKLHEYRELGTREVCGRHHRISAVRLPGNELVILAGFMTPDDVTDGDLSLRRFNIAISLEKLKTHGFDLESTRLSGDGKMEVLMAGLAIAMAWCYAVGEWSQREVEPIKVKAHGRKERSIFGRGLDELMALLASTSSILRRLSRVAFGFLRGRITPFLADTG